MRPYKYGTGKFKTAFKVKHLRELILPKMAFQL
nr:MAG TPA: hypothetical protein [Caudoviricetes sp.]